MFALPNLLLGHCVICNMQFRCNCTQKWHSASPRAISSCNYTHKTYTNIESQTPLQCTGRIRKLRQRSQSLVVQLCKKCCQLSAGPLLQSPSNIATNGPKLLLFIIETFFFQNYFWHLLYFLFGAEDSEQSRECHLET